MKSTGVREMSPESSIWKSGMPVESGVGVGFKEFLGGNPEPVFETKYIIRREHQLKGGTTFIETLDAFMTGESEGVSVQAMQEFIVRHADPIAPCFQAFL